MKNLIAFLSFIFILTINYSCKKTTEDCICNEIYAPVCGDDGIVYSNSCKAECAGVNYSDCEEILETDATVSCLGDPALDGCGWVLEFEDNGEMKNYRADSLATEFQQDSLNVSITYQETSLKSLCGMISFIPVIKIVTIENN